ncbi:uncharacterized protein NECHADRAFT_79613 [Fusarium vanettenii 77-13-4]|uniref:Protein kinase domain-containing protein n=1 Tax=Fusarium vanettenii (strain ATCC MYA-4622 / CBS 123669 / FGSC 9596 / NRRL 45880 / 77-13-4) TaxID=660122 RepID=C7Z7Z7_FUSV7|nr:uncharacterized protein NECHADRAFT_79613 [Fusarium vanettenii 77-13-4]EEU39778.1 predicted protein [Fusarium vanettenii 77-13-4]
MYDSDSVSSRLSGHLSTGSDNSNYSNSLLVKFRFGWSTVSAIGNQNDSYHPNVLRLSILRSSFDRVAIALFRRLPMVIQSLAKSVVPGYFLPSRIVIKKLKPGWNDEFENEKSMYERLLCLQGTLIPKCFGETTVHNNRALILSEVDGVEACSQKFPCLEPPEFQRRIEEAFAELAQFGLAYGDLKLDNFLLVGDRVVIVDLESVWEDTPDEIEYANETHIEHLISMYERHLDGMSNDG